MKTRLLLVVCFATLAGLSGCASPARVIKSDPMSVVVAVPDQTNDWPFHYRDEATKVAATHLSDPVLVSINRVKVGETVTNSGNSSRQDLVNQNNKTRFGEVVNTSSTTAVRDEYEYHLEFQSRKGSSAQPGLPPVPGGMGAGPVQPVGGTTQPPMNNTIRRETPDTRLPPVNPPGNVPPGSFPSTALPGR